MSLAEPIWAGGHVAAYTGRTHDRFRTAIKSCKFPLELNGPSTHDPGFKLACGRLPDSDADLCSQPTISRWESQPDLRAVIRMSYAMVDLYCASYPVAPRSVTLDIDDTVDVVHGHQQLSLFNAHYDERCFLPIHVYDTATSRPVAVLLRPGTTPSGKEVRGYLRRQFK